MMHKKAVMSSVSLFGAKVRTYDHNKACKKPIKLITLCTFLYLQSLQKAGFLQKRAIAFSSRDIWDQFNTDIFYHDKEWPYQLNLDLSFIVAPQNQAHKTAVVKSALSEILEEYCSRSAVGQDSAVYVGEETVRAADLLSAVGIPFARTASGELDLKIGVGLGVILYKEGGIFTQHSWSIWKESTKYRVRMVVPAGQADEILSALD